MVITSHDDGETVGEGPNRLEALVDDDDTLPQFLDVQWSVDGESGYDGSVFWVEAWLEPGDVQIEVEVIDPDLNAASASLGLVVTANQTPLIAVVDPRDAYATEQQILLEASDPDGDEPEVRWELDGAVGGGTTVPLSALGLGEHTLDAWATDAVGAESYVQHVFELVEADADGDGFWAEAVGGEDCDDDDPTINPDADEYCDNVDEDCDGEVDNDALDVVEGTADDDGDGWGGAYTVACFAADHPAGDCDDANAAVNPGAQEICNDGLDNDCDGTPNDCGWEDLELQDSDVSLLGETADDYMGTSVSFVSDLDGDGSDEVFVGSGRCDYGGQNAGCAYLMMGSANLLGEINLSSSDTLFVSDTATDWVGEALAHGDLDGDGQTDFVLGAPRRSGGFGGSAGGVYLVLGPVSAGEVQLSEHALLDPESSGDQLGQALEIADIDGDGVADLLAGATHARNNEQGAVYVALGPSTAWTATIEGDDSNDHLGSAIRVLGDTNGDGYADFITSTPDAHSLGSKTGAAWLFLGDSSYWGQGSMLDPGSHAHATFEGSAKGNQLGASVAAPGDTDGSGYADVGFGAPGQDYGAVHLFLDPVGGTYTDADADVTWTSDVWGKLGVALVMADVDGDGSTDVLGGVPGAKNPDGFNSGHAVLWNDLGGGTTADGFVFHGALGGDDAGVALAAGGDIDGDGFHDLAVGAPGARGGGGNSGVVYVLRGRGF